MQVIEQTQEQKMAMYMKVEKKKLCEMLIECNRILETRNQAGEYFVQPVVSGRKFLPSRIVFEYYNSFTGESLGNSDLVFDRMRSIKKYYSNFWKQQKKFLAEVNKLDKHWVRAKIYFR